MKREMVLMLTLVLMVAMAVTNADAQQYVHTDTIDTYSYVTDIAFKDNGTLIGGNVRGSLYAWNVATGAVRWWEASYGRGNSNNPAVEAVALPSHDPFFIAYGGHLSDYSIRMRYSDDGDFRGKLEGHTGVVYSLAFKPNSYVLASGCEVNDPTIRIWDVGDRDNLRHVRTLRGHTTYVMSVAWSPDGRTLASASWDGTVRLWNPNNGINIAVLRGHADTINDVAWSPDGRTLASASHDDTIRLWDPDTHDTRRVLRGHTQAVGALAFHPNGQTLASGSSDKTIRLWNPNTGAHKATLTRYHGGRNALAFSPNGQILAGRGPNDDDLSLWRWFTVDVTGNGKVNVNDLVEVARNYGRTVAGGANRKADVNNDGEVDFDDVLAVLKAVDAAVEEESVAEDAEGDEAEDAGAPAIGAGRSLLRPADVRQWIRDAKAANVDPAGIAALEQLLAALTRAEAPPPKETVLLANYPNPFNPETWIPYELAEAAEVTVTIHAADGKLVHTLELGQLPAGLYRTKGRAAYWDGRNALNEPVASGVYFYTLTAGDFTATRKMLIRK